jgi:hypothetical protein
LACRAFSAQHWREAGSMTEDTDKNRDALLTAATTEHFVQQTAISVATNEIGARTSIYVVSLSSVLVAMGFVTQSSNAFVPFVATVLPAIFLLGAFTVLRLIDIGAEVMQAYTAMARIHDYYRTLGPEAAALFGPALARWPETNHQPSIYAGPIVGYLTTAATMLGAINALVAAAAVALLMVELGSGLLAALALGALIAIVVMAALYVYQHRRITELAEAAGPPTNA